MSIEVAECERLEEGEYVELAVADCRLHVTESEDTTSVVLADSDVGKQTSVVVEDEERETREE